MDIALFRQEFPEFADVARYPTAQISMYLGLANVQVPLQTWGTDILPYAQKLYAAHMMVINQSGNSTKGGPVSSKSVGSVSVSYDTAGGSEKDAGWYNLSTYGKQYYRLMLIYGAGVIQL